MGWTLSNEIREKNEPMIKRFIEEVERTNKEMEINLSDSGLNPMTLIDLLEDYGYSKEDIIDTNGWEVDFWVKMVHETKPTLSIRGTAMIFELYLYYQT